jgi:hypothetical protein
MAVYQCKYGPVTIRFGYQDFTFANNQIVNTTRPEISTHPAFVVVNDSRLQKRAPQLHQIQPYPKPTEYMSGEEIVQELKGHNVMADPYELTDKLAYQLNMLRQLTRKTYITVLDDEGNSLWYEEFMALEREAKKKAKEVQPINTPEVKVVKPKELKIEEKEYKLATPNEVKSKGGSIGAVEYNDEYDMTRENELTDLINAKLKENFESPVDRVTKDKFSLFKTEAETVEDKDITIENFSYLVDTVPFCLQEVPDEEKANMKKFKIKEIKMDVMVTFLKSKGIFIKTDAVSDRVWVLRNKIKELLENSSKQEEMIVELNMLQYRTTEIDATATKSVKNFKKQGLKGLVTKLNRYGIDVDYTGDATHIELRQIVARCLLLCKYGIKNDTNEKLMEFFEKCGIADVACDVINTKEQWTGEIVENG